VAAVSVSERVGVELNDASLVGYQVRYDKKLAKETMRIKFMTDGILLREIQDDIRLPKYSVIVIDEAHERSINCDILLGLLSGSIRVRQAMNKPLKVVVMSATLNMTDFTNNPYLFPKKSTSPPVVNIDNKMFPVTVHYERKTLDDYIQVAVDKIDKIHKTLPPGTILVFVTGKAEVHKVCNAFKTGQREIADDTDESATDDESPTKKDSSIIAASSTGDKKRKLDNIKDHEDGIEDFTLGDDKAFIEELVFDKSGNVTSSSTAESSRPSSGGIFTGGGPDCRLRIFPLYAQMSSEAQLSVFRANIDFPQERIVVVSTNVAETSLTIPNVRYVIDCGREKRREFNSNGVSRFAVRFTSKASANQRSGRCGRVGSGHVYRLYSPNVFGEHMAEYPAPEIETNPLDSAILLLKTLGIPSLENFPWPTPPPKMHVNAAIKRLHAINAIEGKDDRMTIVGKKIPSFPVCPRLAVALITALDRQTSGDLIIAMCAIVALLSVDCTIDTPPELMKGREILIRDFNDDLQMMITWFQEWLQVVEEKEKFCQLRSLSVKGMGEVRALYCQLVSRVSDPDSSKRAIECMRELNLKNSKLLHGIRECCLHGFVDQIAYRDEAGSSAYRAPGSSDEVFIHRSSALFRRRPQWIAYFEMVQASGEFSDKRSMRTCFMVDPEYLAEYVKSPLIDRSKQHPLMKTRIVGQKRYGYVIPRYIPLSLTIRDCLAVQLDD